MIKRAPSWTGGFPLLLFQGHYIWLAFHYKIFSKNTASARFCVVEHGIVQYTGYELRIEACYLGRKNPIYPFN